MPTYSKDQIVTALHSTFIANPESLKITNDYLTQASKKRGFCMCMMQIVDDSILLVEVKQAALILLKNTIKERWVSQHQSFPNTQKQSIRGALILAIMRCHRNHKLIKLYKEVFTTITRYDYQIWLPVRQIVDQLSQDRDATALLHMLLAIADIFQQSYTQDQCIYFYEFLKIVLPELQNLLERRPQLQLIYFCIKFLWKAVNHKLSQQLKQMTCSWMRLLTAIVGAKNPKYDQHPDDFQTRETEEFYYFHSKKWATRILLQFIQKHATVRILNKKQDNKFFSEYWYSTYGINLVNALIGQFSIQTSKKVRYFQLKCLQALIRQKPEAVKHYADIFQYQILLDYLRLKPQDKQLAHRQPVQFIYGEEQPSISFTKLKRVATHVWVAFAQLGSIAVKKTKSFQPGMFLITNMNYLQRKLEDRTNFIEKELAMYLIYKLSSSIIKYQEIANKLPELLAKYILPEFTTQCMFLRARALDIFSVYGSIKFEENLVRQTLEGIYNCLTKDVAPLVRIRAARAFSCILKHQIAKELVRPILRDILTVYLQLLQKYDLQYIVYSLQSIVQIFTNEVGPFSVDLIKRLTILFFKFFNKDALKSDQQEFDSQAEKTAASCLNIIIRIISSPIQPDCVTKIEADVVSIIEFLFYKQGTEFMQLALDLLNGFLFKVPQMSRQIWFFYQAVVYNMVGIPKEMWPSIQQLKMPLKHKLIMITIRSVQNIEMMQRSTPVLRNYIQKSSVNTQPDHETVKANIIQLLFYLITQIYKRLHSRSDGEVWLECCTNLLTCLLQNYQQKLPQQVYIHIYEFIKNNITNFRGQMLKVQTSQLIGMLLWLAPTLGLNLAYRDGFLSIFLKQLVSYQSKYKNKLERARVIIGINSLILLHQKPPVIMQNIPQLFKTAIILVKKNAQQRIQDDQNLVEGDQSEYFGKDQDQDEDEQDFQQYENKNKYNSAIYLIDQILQFKTTMERLSWEQPQMYSELLKTVAVKDWPVFLYKLRKVLQKVEKVIS